MYFKRRRSFREYEDVKRKKIDAQKCKFKEDDCFRTKKYLLQSGNHRLRLTYFFVHNYVDFIYTEKRNIFIVQKCLSSFNLRFCA